MEIPLKYGCNPHQKVARVTCDGPCPLEIVHGAPSYINILDAVRGWQLVRDLHRSVGKAGAASFKHVSPAGAAVASDLSYPLRQAAFIEPDAELSPVATAYAKARSSDRPASFGDFVAVSERVDLTLANLLKPEVSDGIIAPSYDQDALDVLKAKKGGKYVILRMDPDYQPPATDLRRDFGLTLEQSYNDVLVNTSQMKNIVTDNKDMPESVIETAIVTTIALKHTQSNSVAIGYEGHAIGIGAGQQSRIACTRLCCEKAERWLLKMHPKTLALHFADGIKRAEATNLVEMFVRYDELDAVETAQLRGGLKYPPEPISDEERREWLSQFGGLVCSSDAFFPFRDNIDRAAQTGVRYVVQAGGSTRDEDVIDAANEHGIVMTFTGLRLFLH